MYFLLKISFIFPGALTFLTKYSEFNIHNKNEKNHNILTSLLFQKPQDKEEFFNIKKSVDFFYEQNVSVSENNLSLSDLKTSQPEGCNVLFYLTNKLQYFEFYERIIKKGEVDIDHKNEGGQTPLINSSIMNSNAGVFLLKMGANPYIKNFVGENALTMAKKWNYDGFLLLTSFIEKEKLQKNLKQNKKSKSKFL